MRRFLRSNESGSVLIEFAIALPVLLLFFAGVVEISRYFQFREKLASATLQTLDVINQNTNVNAASLDNLFAAIPDMMEPYKLYNIRIVLTQVVRPAIGGRACKPVALWQYPVGLSKVASGPGSVANVGSINLMNNDSVLALEITSDYQPIVDSGFVKDFIGSPNLRIYKLGYAHARYGAFTLDPITQSKRLAPCL